MQRYEHGGNIYGQQNIVLDFSVNTNPLGMPEAAKQAVVESLPTYETYPDPCSRQLRAALATHHGLTGSMVLCGNGAAELILALCACTQPRQALTLAPTFSEYERAVTLWGGQMRVHCLQEAAGFALTEDILAQLTPPTDLFFLGNPNNPSGRLIEPDLVRKIAQACFDNGTLLLLDECFMEFTCGQSLLPQLRHYPNVLVLQAFTKIYAMAGLRLGTLYCADEQLLARIAEYTATWSVSAVAQAAGIAALQADGWLENTQRVVEAERAFMTTQLRGLGFTVYPSDANFLLIQSAKPLAQALRARGILVRCCANFSGLGEQYIRIGLKTHEKNMALVQALTEISNG